MAAAQDLQDLEDCLNVCGLQAAQEIAGIIIREGYESLEEFSQLRPDDVPGMAKNLRTRPAAQRAHYSDRQIRALSALLYWLNERNSTGQALDIKASIRGDQVNPADVPGYFSTSSTCRYGSSTSKL